MTHLFLKPQSVTYQVVTHQVVTRQCVTHKICDGSIMVVMAETLKRRILCPINLPLNWFWHYQ